MAQTYNPTTGLWEDDNENEDSGTLDGGLSQVFGSGSADIGMGTASTSSSVIPQGSNIGLDGTGMTTKSRGDGTYDIFGSDPDTSLGIGYDSLPDAYAALSSKYYDKNITYAAPTPETIGEGYWKGDGSDAGGQQWFDGSVTSAHPGGWSFTPPKEFFANVEAGGNANGYINGNPYSGLGDYNAGLMNPLNTGGGLSQWTPKFFGSKEEILSQLGKLSVKDFYGNPVQASDLAYREAIARMQNGSTNLPIQTSWRDIVNDGRVDQVSGLASLYGSKPIIKNGQLVGYSMGLEQSKPGDYGYLDPFTNRVTDTHGKTTSDAYLRGGYTPEDLKGIGAQLDDKNWFVPKDMVDKLPGWAQMDGYNFHQVKEKSGFAKFLSKALPIIAIAALAIPGLQALGAMGTSAAGATAGAAGGALAGESALALGGGMGAAGATGITAGTGFGTGALSSMGGAAGITAGGSGLGISGSIAGLGAGSAAGGFTAAGLAGTGLGAGWSGLAAANEFASMGSGFNDFVNTFNPANADASFLSNSFDPSMMDHSFLQNNFDPSVMDHSFNAADFVPEGKQALSNVANSLPDPSTIQSHLNAAETLDPFATQEGVNQGFSKVTGYGMDNPYGKGWTGLPTGTEQEIANMYNTMTQPMGGTPGAPSPLKALYQGGKAFMDYRSNQQAMDMFKKQMALANQGADPNRGRGNEANRMWTENFQDPRAGMAEFMGGAGRKFIDQARASAAKNGTRGSYLNSGMINSDLASLYLQNQNARGNALAQGFERPVNTQTDILKSMGPLMEMKKNEYSPFGQAIGYVGRANDLASGAKGLKDLYDTISGWWS